MKLPAPVFTISPTGVADSKKEDELENTEESSDTESESEESLENEPSLGGLSNEQNNEPLGSSTDKVKPTIIDLPNQQLPAASEDEANNSLTTSEEVSFCIFSLFSV